MPFNVELAQKIAKTITNDENSEKGLVRSFTQVCNFLYENPDRLSWRGIVKPSLKTEEGITILAKRYFESYRKSDFPSDPQTIPDEIVSIVLQVAYGYKTEELGNIKVQHQHSMNAESCIGAILERYIDTVLRPHEWHWCCGSFVRAIDFIKKNEDGTWLAVQVKNRDNSENSSSMAIRDGTDIQKWFRSFSKTGKTNWDNLPNLMKGHELNEKGFIEFTTNYLNQEKLRLQKK